MLNKEQTFHILDCRGAEYDRPNYDSVADRVQRVHNLIAWNLIPGCIALPNAGKCGEKSSRDLV